MMWHFLRSFFRWWSDQRFWAKDFVVWVDNFKYGFCTLYTLKVLWISFLIHNICYKVTVWNGTCVLQLSDRKLIWNSRRIFKVRNEITDVTSSFKKYFALQILCSWRILRLKLNSFEFRVDFTHFIDNFREKRKLFT